MSEVWWSELDGWRDRVRSRRHVDSGLRPYTDDEIEAGIAAVGRTAYGGRAPLVSDTRLTLLVPAG